MAQLQSTTLSGSILIPNIPSTASLGNMWFIGKLKCSNIMGVWSTGGSLGTAAYIHAGTGTQNAALKFGGKNSSLSPSYIVCTEEYGGSSWTAGGNLTDGRMRLAGAGTQNAALAFGGITTPYTVVACTEEYGGSSWTAGGALPSARYNLAGAGTQNAGLAFGGADSSYALLNCTEEYNGSSWTAGGNLTITRCFLKGSGTQNAALAFGGLQASLFIAVNCTEEYNGSSWATASPLLSGGVIGHAGTKGNSDSTLSIGGYNQSTITESYNGLSWYAGGKLNNLTQTAAGAGDSTSGLVFGGYISAETTCTEEYNESAGGIGIYNL